MSRSVLHQSRPLGRTVLERPSINKFIIIIIITHLLEKNVFYTVSRVEVLKIVPFIVLNGCEGLSMVLM